MITIAHLVAEEVQWVVKCRNCKREVRLYPADLARMFEPETTEQEARGRLKCKRCFTRGQNYLSATPGKSYDPNAGKSIATAWRGVYEKLD